MQRLAPGAVVCLRCRTPRWEGSACPVCALEEGRVTPARGRSSPQWCELTPVFEAPHEIAAISVQAVLREDDIPAVLRSSLIPVYGGVAMTLAGCWGWVLVPKEDANRARTVVHAYLKSLGVIADGADL
jgi:hypothetical protein